MTTSAPLDPVTRDRPLYSVRLPDVDRGNRLPDRRTQLPLAHLTVHCLPASMSTRGARRAEPLARIELSGTVNVCGLFAVLASCHAVEATFPHLVLDVPGCSWRIHASHWLYACAAAFARAGYAEDPDDAAEIVYLGRTLAYWRHQQDCFQHVVANPRGAPVCPVLLQDTEMTALACAWAADYKNWPMPKGYDGPDVTVRLETTSGTAVCLPLCVLRCGFFEWNARIVGASAGPCSFEPDSTACQLYETSLQVYPGQSVRGDPRTGNNRLAVITCIGLEHAVRGSAAFASAYANGRVGAVDAGLVRERVGAIATQAVSLVACIAFALVPGCDPWHARLVRRLRWGDPGSTWDGLAPVERDVLRALHLFYMSGHVTSYGASPLVEYAIAQAHVTSVACVGAHLPAPGLMGNAVPPYALTGAYSGMTVDVVRLSQKTLGRLGPVAPTVQPESLLWDPSRFWDKLSATGCNDVVRITMHWRSTNAFVYAIGVQPGTLDVCEECIVAPGTSAMSWDTLLMSLDNFRLMQLYLVVATAEGSPDMHVLPNQALFGLVYECVVTRTHRTLGPRGARYIRVAFLERLCRALCHPADCRNEPAFAVTDVFTELIYNAIVYGTTRRDTSEDFSLSAYIRAVLLIQPREHGVARIEWRVLRALVDVMTRYYNKDWRNQLHDLSMSVPDDGYVVVPHAIILSALSGCIPLPGVYSPVPSHATLVIVGRLATALGVEYMDCWTLAPAIGWVFPAMSNPKVTDRETLIGDAISVLLTNTRADALGEVDYCGEASAESAMFASSACALSHDMEARDTLDGKSYPDFVALMIDPAVLAPNAPCVCPGHFRPLTPYGLAAAAMTLPGKPVEDYTAEFQAAIRPKRMKAAHALLVGTTEEKLAAMTRDFVLSTEARSCRL